MAYEGRVKPGGNLGLKIIRSNGVVEEVSTPSDSPLYRVRTGLAKICRRVF